MTRLVKFTCDIKAQFIFVWPNWSSPKRLIFHMPGDAFELTLKAVNIVLIKQSILITKQKELFTVNLAFFFKAQHFSFGSMYFALFFFFF